MNTRDKILDTALRLFNQQGLAGVSIRDIAAAMGISDGNLRYHFRTRDELVEALFNRLADNIGDKLFASIEQPLTIGLMKNMLAHLMQQFYEYRFLMQDLPAITQSHPGVSKKFHKITKERTLIIHQVINTYVETGYMYPETHPEQYKKLVENVLIISHFWINGATLFYTGKKKDMVAYYTELIFSLMYPYFTEKTKGELGL